MTLIAILSIIGIVGCIGGTLLAAFHKYGVLSWIQAHAKSDRAHKFFTCYTCLSLLIDAIISIVFAIILWHWIPLVAILGSPIITRHLILN